jgi:hypothetical protein
MSIVNASINSVNSRDHQQLLVIGNFSLPEGLELMPAVLEEEEDVQLEISNLPPETMVLKSVLILCEAEMANIQRLSPAPNSLCCPLHILASFSGQKPSWPTSFASSSFQKCYFSSSFAGPELSFAWLP